MNAISTSSACSPSSCAEAPLGQRVIGVDFDNTIISYDALLAKVVVELGLLPANAAQGKQAIRDVLRLGAEGDITWQRVQALIYGPRLREAALIPGVLEFFAACQQRGWVTHIISHKTEFAAYDATRTPLRAMAMAWLREQGLLATERTGLDPTRVHFAASRAEKLATIARLGCADFIDDLEETFREAAFPPGVRRWLYAPHGCQAPPPATRVANTWAALRAEVLAHG